MDLTNLTATEYTISLGGLKLPANGSVTVDNDEYLEDTYLRHAVNALVAASHASVTGGPVGFPVEDPASSGSFSGDAADVNIADAGGNFTATNVEDALAELAASPGGPIILFDSGDLSPAAASIDTLANGIAGGYRLTDVLIRAKSAIAASNETLRVTFNGDTASHYQVLGANMGGGGPTLGGAFGNTGGPSGPVAAFPVSGSSGPPANHFSTYSLRCPGYADAYNKLFTWQGGYMVDGGNQQMLWGMLQYDQTTPISRMKIDFPSGNLLVAGSRLTVIGYV